MYALRRIYSSNPALLILTALPTFAAGIWPDVTSSVNLVLPRFAYADADLYESQAPIGASPFFVSMTAFLP